MCLSKEKFESNMITRFRADSTGVIDELSGSGKCKIWHMKFRELSW